MIGRIVWLALLALVAAIAVAAQLDRAARYQATFAPLVPAPFRGFAAQRLTEAAILAEDPQAAEAAARQLVEARPLPAEHLRLLSQAAWLAEDSGFAISALELASARGWRDPLVQLAAGEAALLQGQHEAVAQRVSALLAAGNLPEQTSQLLAKLLADPDGRAAFAPHLATPATWPANVLGRPASAVAPADMARTLKLALDQGASLPCERLEPLARQYQRDGNGEAARIFWPGECTLAQD